MDDIYAKNNVEWTEEHASMFDKNGIKNIAQVLLECKYLKFPTSEQIEKSEKELAKLDKHKNRFLYNHNMQKTKKHG